MFRFFRRYQKIFIVVGGVILMFVFTVGDSLTQWVARGQNDSSGRNPKATVVSWDGGKLTEHELDRLVWRRRVVSRFVNTVYQYGMMLASQSNLPDVGPRAFPVGMIGQNWSQAMLEESVVNTHLLAERGHEMGIEISDKAVRDYIYDLGMGQLGGDEIRGILAEMNPAGRQPSLDELFAALKDELLAEAVVRAFGAGFNTQDMFAAEMPVNRWEEWKRLNDNIVLEAAAIDPSSASLDVPEPTDEQLREFYDEHKNSAGLPVEQMGVELPSPEPGFTLPRKVKLQYLRANYNEFVERYKQQITDEQIREYYEENKNPMFIEASFDDMEFEDRSAAPEEDADDSTGSDPSDEGQSQEDTEESNGGEGEEQPSTEPADGQEASSEESGEPASESESPADQPSEDADAPGAGETPEADEAPPAEDQQGSVERVKNPFRLVAYQQPDDEDSADQPAEDDGEEAAQGETEDAEGGETENTEVMEEEVEVEYQPLEEVEDKIRDTLAREKYFDEIDKQMQGAVARLNPAYSQYVSKKLDAEGTGGELPEAPQELRNLSPIASELNLEFEETGELDGFQLRDSRVGQSTGVGKYNEQSLTQLVFSNRVDMYEPVLTADVGRFGDRYLVMKIDDVASRTPSFDEAKDKVREAWKQREAAKLALEKARKTAEEVEESGLSLKDFMVDRSDVEVTTTPPFTQLTVGEYAPTSRSPTYRLAQPSGLKSVGSEFLSEVFKLKQGEVVALPNFDESTIYLVRLADEYESQEQLRSDFLEQANFWPGRDAFRDSNLQVARRTVARAIIDGMKPDWKRDLAAAPTADEDTDGDEAESDE